MCTFCSLSCGNQIKINVVFRAGIATLYRGMESKLIQTVLTSAFMFATYEHIVSGVFLLLAEFTAIATVL